MSTLSAFPFIGEQSFATPGAINSPLSIISANIAAVNAAGGAVSGVTITPPSGNTITIASDLSVLGTIAAGPARLGVNSNVTNYLFLSDTSHARSNYVIGSQVGGTADGLNIWDDSGSTMIVSFSKQSVRFFQQVVGPVFDVGGALASTLNAATFGGSLVTTQIQAAISAASNAIPKIKRVYVPASMYPYDPRQLSFDTNVQMVREGGAWDVFDVQAYGAGSSLALFPAAWNTIAMQAAIHAANGAGGGIVYVPTGQYAISSLTVPRRVTLRGSGGGRHLDATVVSELLSSAATTMILLGDQGGSGAVIENIQLAGSGSANLGGIRIAGMAFCLIRNVGVSGTSVFAIEIIGGNDTNFNAIEDCALTMSSVGTAVNVSCNSILGMDSSPFMTGCYVSTDAPTAWLSFQSVSGGIQPDSPLVIANRFITTSTATAIYGQVTNGRFISNRFEAVAGGINVSLAPPTGSQAAGEFIANSWGITGGTLVWTDSAATPSTRWLELVNNGINAVPGTAINPAYAFGSENSLGFYRSGVSTIGLSYGAIALPTGSATTPALTFSSETSLGWYRSTVSTMNLSYGTLRLLGPTTIVTPGIAGSGGSGRLLSRAGDFFGLSINWGATGAQDFTSYPSWTVDLHGGTGSSDEILISHANPNGGLATKWSWDSLGNASGNAGTASAPGYTFRSEASLGLYRSGVSTMVLSYGTFDLTASGAVTSIASLTIKSGANNSCGTAVLGSNGSVNVANTYVKTGDLIFLTDQTPGGTLGDLEVGGIRNSSGFTIQSTSVTDTSTVGWLIVRPG